MFFCAAVYSIFMSYYLLPQQPKIFQGRAQSNPFGGGGRAGAGPATGPTTGPNPKKIVTAVVAGMFGILFLFFLIGFFSALGDEETAPVDEQATEESSPDDSTDDNQNTLVGKGNEFFNSQQYDSADRYYNLALEADGANMEAVYGKGIVQWQKGNVDDANAFFLRSYEGGYRYAWLSWALGDMYDKRGNNSRAIGFYKESLGLDSSYTDCYKRLAELEPANSTMYLELAEKHK